MEYPSPRGGCFLFFSISSALGAPPFTKEDFKRSGLNLSAATGQKGFNRPQGDFKVQYH